MSKIKVDTITNVAETGFITISGNTSFDLSGSTYGLVLPNGDTAQRPTTASLGALRFNTEESQVEFWNGEEWLSLGSAGGAGGLPAGTAADPFLYPNQAKDLATDSGVAFFATGAASSKELRWFKFTHGSETRVWVVVCARNKNASDLFTTAAVNDGSSSSSNHFKLADTDIEYLTNGGTNTERYGMAYFPAISSDANVNMTVGLFASADANLWRHVDWATSNTGIPTGWSNTNASSTTPSMRASATTNFSSTLPTTFNGQSDTNAYCGGTQILSNWDDTGEDLWSARFNSAGGCAYCGENSGTFADPNLVGNGADYGSYLHVLMVS